MNKQSEKEEGRKRKRLKKEKGEVEKREKEKEEKRKRKDGRKRDKRQKERGREVGNIRIVFWNVAGLKNKDNKFWKKIGKWDVIVLIETWIDKKG